MDGKVEMAEVISVLRKLLIDLEAGKVVRVALDLQTLIQKLEDGSCVDVCESCGSRGWVCSSGE
jgi:hypothetical protein